MSDELETAVPESIPADAASAASAPESAPVKPKRATTRKKAAPAADAADASDGASAGEAVAANVAAVASEEGAPAVKKPATRKRTTAAKKTPDKTAAIAGSESAVKASATETPAPAAPAESVGEAASTAPKKSAARKTTATRTRRKPALAEAESPVAAETASEAASDAAASASATVGANAASAAAPEKAANTSETPDRTPRTRTRTKAASAASGARSGTRKPAASRAKAAASSSDAASLAPIEFSSDADVIATETLADPSLPAGQSSKGNGASAAEVLSVEVLVTDAPQSAASGVLIEASAGASAAEGSPEPATPNRVRRERNNERNGNNNKKRPKQNQNQNQNQGSSDKGNGQNQQNQQSQNKANNKGSFDRDHRRQRRQHGSREVLPSISRDELAEMKVGDLREKAAEYSIDASGYRKAELVDVVFEALCKAEGIIEVTGILDIMNDGYGFLRAKGYLPSEGDAYVSLSIIRRNGLRKGDYVVGLTRPAQGNEKYAAIQKVISVNDTPADELGGRVRFADLTPIYPDERLIMEHGKSTTTARVIDLVSPIGKGQRGLIVSPPKAGKTTVLKDIAAAISANNPEVHLMCLLVDERPEEVTDMERSIKGEVISSTFDKPCENHIAVAELVIERAKRLVEQGRDVVILLDSITRLARAYNMGTPASGRILSGGVDSSALYPPKRFLGAARNIENGGSLTILGTALVDTGSKMDEVIFEEFKGTGNSEIILDRKLSDKRVYPAIDITKSGTRKEDLLVGKDTLSKMYVLRRIINPMGTLEAMEFLLDKLRLTKTNADFFGSMNQ